MVWLVYETVIIHLALKTALCHDLQVLLELIKKKKKNTA